MLRINIGTCTDEYDYEDLGATFQLCTQDLYLYESTQLVASQSLWVCPRLVVDS